jgi:arylsulfatase A-like enzyme
MNTIRAIIIATLLLASLAELHAAEAPLTATKPNFVYLLADQWRASATGYAGDSNVKTPYLDRLAKEGLNFRNVVSVCPVCTPYRAALMTGRYPTSTGMFLNDAQLPDSELCMAEVFKSAGYTTAYIGKWHLDGHGRTSYIPPERRRGWEYWKGAECDHGYNHSHYYTGHSSVKQFWQGYDAFAQTQDAQKYLRDHAHGPQPFVLLVAYGSPHFPHATAPDEYKALYPPDQIKLPPNVPEVMQARARQEAQGYYAHCTALDKCVGALLQTLEETGIYSNTVVVFTSDHGEMMGSHQCSPGMKQVPWSESANVPFLLRYPAIQGGSGRIVNMPLTTPDILPTLLGLAGVQIPSTVEGEDLSSLLRTGREGDRAALYMNVSPFAGHGFDQPYRAVRTDRYTYVRGLEGPWLLFDDVKDPHQMDNLVAKPEFAALRAQLDGRLQVELRKISDDFRPARAYLEEWGYRVSPGNSVPYGNQELNPPPPKRKSTTRSTEVKP